MHDLRKQFLEAMLKTKSSKPCFANNREGKPPTVANKRIVVPVPQPFLSIIGSFLLVGLVLWSASTSFIWYEHNNDDLWTREPLAGLTHSSSNSPHYFYCYVHSFFLETSRGSLRCPDCSVEWFYRSIGMQCRKE